MTGRNSITVLPGARPGGPVVDLASALDLSAGPSWMAMARCANADPGPFFPDRAGSWKQAQAAKAVCAGCTVREECLEYALDAREEHGVWGGTSARERRTLARGRPARPLRLPDRCAAGHFYEPGSYRVRPDGGRMCLACEAARSRRRRAASKEATN